MRLFCIMVCVFLFGLAVVSCTPYRLSRIGPVQPERPPTCELEVLGPGQVPSRPYRNIGMVELQNCQEYDQGLCAGWLREAACELGGQVAYPLDGPIPRSGVGPTTYALFVAVYPTGVWTPVPPKNTAAEVPCDPPCAPEKRCHQGVCKDPADCNDPPAANSASPAPAATPAPERCTE